VNCARVHKNAGQHWSRQCGILNVSQPYRSLLQGQLFFLLLLKQFKEAEISCCSRNVLGGGARSWNVFRIRLEETWEGGGRDRAGDCSFPVGFLIDSGSNLDVPGEE
jgi:hypothetical protein